MVRASVPGDGNSWGLVLPAHRPCGGEDGAKANLREFQALASSAYEAIVVLRFFMLSSL